MKIKVKKYITYFVLFLITIIASAQQVNPPTPGGGGSGVSNTPPPPGGPISDYLYLLVFVGVWYGIKKIKSLSTD